MKGSRERGPFFVVATASRNWWVCEMEKHPLWGNVEKCSKDVDSRIYAFFCQPFDYGFAQFGHV